MKFLKHVAIMYLRIITLVLMSGAPLILLPLIWSFNVFIIFKILGVLLLLFLSVLIIGLWEHLDDKIDDKLQEKERSH